MTDAAAAEVRVPRLLIWRHGRTEWNAGGRFQGQLDPPLDETGRHQAVLAAPHLASGLSPEETVVVSSDLSRAAETAETLTALLGVPLRLDVRLREHGIKPVRREGVAESRWVLLDFIDVVVHVQHAEERAYYALERLWKDCPTIPFADRAAAERSPDSASGGETTDR